MPPTCAEELAHGIPYARLVVFEHSGHYPFAEEPQTFWAIVREFLEDSPSPSVEPIRVVVDGTMAG
jgi:proline iminopeptidase